MYLRFATPREDKDSHQSLGVFQAAYDLLHGGDLAPDATERLKESLGWFETYLPIPDRSILKERAIFWFRAEAETADLVRRVWGLANLLSRYATRAELIRTTRPGFILYEDSCQVAAV